MQCTVTLLRKDGRVITVWEAPRPITGRLEMVEHSVKPSSFRRSARVLQVMERVGSIEKPAISLFDPQLMEVGPDSLVFRGIEQKSQDNQIFEHQQVWRVLIQKAGQ